MRASTSKHPIGKRLLYYGATLLLLAVVTEVVLRIGWAEQLRPWNNELNTAYHFHGLFGWHPTPRFEGELAGSTRYSVRHNSLGFRDRELDPKQGPRLLVLGDSFVYGYDVNEGERFTDLLADQLPNWEIINLGVSGYGPAQEYLLLQHYFEQYKPDVVFQLFEYGNDASNSSSNMAVGGYYRPYFTQQTTGLRLEGVPVPKGIRYYQAQYPTVFSCYLVRALFLGWIQLTNPRVELEQAPTSPIIAQTRQFVEQQGANYLLGFTGTDEQQSELTFCSQQNLPCVLLTSNKRYPNFGQHWTAAGHAEVAQQLLNFLQEQNIQ